MVIHNQNAVSRLAKILQPERVERVQQPQPPVRKTEGDTVTLSAQGREMHALRMRLAEVPDIRADRVAALKAAISAGTYRVSSQAVAESMLRGD